MEEYTTVYPASTIYYENYNYVLAQTSKFNHKGMP